MAIVLSFVVSPACSDLAADDQGTGGAADGDGGAGGAHESGGAGGGGGQAPEPTPLHELHLTSIAVDAVPTNLDGFLGPWDQVDPHVIAQGPMVLGAEPGGTGQSSTASEDTPTTPWNVALLQAVSAPMAAHTLAGDMTWTISVDQSAPGADYVTHVYLAVWTEGEHCVLADWTEPDALERDWALNLSSTPSEPVALEPCDVPAGARLVLELGYTSKNDHAISRSGTLYYGGEGPRTFTFSQDILFQ